MTKTKTFYITYSTLLQDFSLSKAAYKVACLLLKSHNYSTGYSYKSKETMAKECHCSHSTITRAIRELCGFNILKVEYFFGDHRQKKNCGRQSSNKYFLNLKEIKKGLKSKFVTKVYDDVSLSTSELKVYHHICEKICNRKTVALSRKEIAYATQISDKTVFYTIKALELKGLIAVARSNNSSNIFSLVKTETTVDTEISLTKTSKPTLPSQLKAKLTLYLLSILINLSEAKTVKTSNTPNYISFFKTIPTILNNYLITLLKRLLC